MTAVLSPAGYASCPGGNIARMEAYAKANNKFRDDVFSSLYGSRQISLRLILTHPDHWRRGAGSLMLQWGVKTATKEGVAIVLFASPWGNELYESFGFRELGILRVSLPGESREMLASGMAWDESQH